MRRILASSLMVTALLASMAWSESSQLCLSCHDFGPESPVHPMLEGSHGYQADACTSCHGASDTHTQRPTITSPDVSYGPRWGATPGDQDAQCLACHDDDVAAHWSDALHMVNDLTCVTCHDMHAENDKVLNEHSQAEVCTICHKTQKTGIHALVEHQTDNPACTSCHNPHADQRAVTTMLANRSEGCRTCHDLVAMALEQQSTEKARSYHKVMAQSDRTCLDCHQGVAHGPAGAVEPFAPFAVAERTVSLFYPGQSDVDWMLSEHPGAQPFRQGTNCQQCHRGEETGMGQSLGGGEQPSRDIDLRFREDESTLFIRLSFAGTAEDKDVAFMWGDTGNAAFRRGGCWAACHSDMPGMSRDRGQGLGKYLSDSRSQEKLIGQPALLKDKSELQALMQAGNFVELWKVDLETGQLHTGTLLADLVWSSSASLRGKVNYSDGRWTVELTRPLIAPGNGKSFSKNGKYTFGMALHGRERSGGKHWVSLPMTLALDGEDTDFRAD
jgi:predicted CXXCH cytochrome family protein